MITLSRIIIKIIILPIKEIISGFRGDEEIKLEDIKIVMIYHGSTADERYKFRRIYN